MWPQQRNPRLSKKFTHASFTLILHACVYVHMYVCLVFAWGCKYVGSAYGGQRTTLDAILRSSPHLRQELPVAWTYPITLDWLTSKFRDFPVLTSTASGLQVHSTRTGIVPRFSGLNSLPLWRSTLPTIYLLGPYVVNNFLYFNCKLSLWNFPLEAPYHFSKS